MITKSITDLFSKVISKVIILFFPSSCYICKKEIIETSLCAECLITFRKPIDTPSPFIVSLYSFKDTRLKKIIHAIKYFHRKDLILPFAKILAGEIKKMDHYEDYILVPIPMPKLRKYIRGYNHTEPLVKEIAKELGLTYNNDLLQNNPTHNKRQVMTHSRNERLRNRHNAFTAHRSVQNMNIILIDDVATTGATMIEARKVLLRQGASRVTAYTIAH